MLKGYLIIRKPFQQPVMFAQLQTVVLVIKEPIKLAFLRLVECLVVYGFDGQEKRNSVYSCFEK